MLAVDEHLRQATGRGHDLGHLVLVDVDDFKQINDRHGHDTGDQVLAAVAQAIERCAEPQVCGRLGGEEFGVLLSGTTDPAAFGRCLCEAVAGLGAAGLPITVSVGIAPSGPMTRSASPSARPTRRSTAPSARARTAACWPSPPPAAPRQPSPLKAGFIPLATMPTIVHSEVRHGFPDPTTWCGRRDGRAAGRPEHRRPGRHPG
jgi:hypothetical protein